MSPGTSIYSTCSDTAFLRYFCFNSGFNKDNFFAITLPPLKAFHILFSFSLKIQYHTILCKIAQYFPLIICLCCLAKIWQWLCAKILSATYFFCMGLCIKRRLKSQKADKAGNCYQSASAQGTRFGIGQQIQASIIFSRFVQKLETVKKHVL